MSSRKRMQHGSISKADFFVIYSADGSVESQCRWDLLWISKQQRFCQERCDVPDGVDDDATSFSFSALPDVCVKALIDALCFLSALEENGTLKSTEKVIAEVEDVPWERIGLALNCALCHGTHGGRVAGNVPGHNGWADLTSFISETLE
jgi:hypothetical protein